MRPLSKARPKEKTIERAIRVFLAKRGWLTEKTHGNQFQAGWPDLMLFHTPYNHRWLEVKRPGGKLTPAQRKRFAEWETYGLGVWVADRVTMGSQTVEDLLSGPPNWRDWLPKRQASRSRR